MTLEDVQDTSPKISYEVSCFEWKDIEEYLNQIIDMQFENTYKFHYPEKEPNRDYIKSKIMEMKGHLNNGKTYFVGAKWDGKLYGYIWGFESMFIDEKRLHLNSLFVCKEARRTGLGELLINKLKEIALLNNCDSIGTHYASFNVDAGDFYSKHGFSPTRVELVCKLK